MKLDYYYSRCDHQLFYFFFVIFPLGSTKDYLCICVGKDNRRLPSSTFSLYNANNNKNCVTQHWTPDNNYSLQTLLSAMDRIYISWKSSDVVVVVTPLANQTHHLFPTFSSITKIIILLSFSYVFFSKTVSRSIHLIAFGPALAQTLPNCISTEAVFQLTKIERKEICKTAPE